MVKFVSFGELVVEVDADGNPKTIVHEGEDMPAGYPENSLKWLADNGYAFDPMPGAAEQQAAPMTAPEEPATAP